ncbi:helix-turn-helix transcriptional regulator [Natronosalvus vescus]|uniref:helix-turn-helix transcriptional regulator n=1 Tax=Natronosalvus vescus TaxID=2953881 RepID=UPI0020918D04|nr:transcriptional regulator [Natronosalvus vescus]
MASPSRSNPLETISRRYDLLAALEADPGTKADLEATTDSSRSTVDRGVRELMTFGLLERDEGRLRLTMAGRLALSAFRDARNALESVVDVSHLLAAVPTDAPLSMALLEGATIHEPSRLTPNQPLETIANRLQDAVRFRGIAATEPIPQFRRILTERTIAGHLDAEVVFTDELLSFVLDDHGASLERVFQTGRFHGHVVESIPYGLVLLETTTTAYTFVVVTDDGETVGVIENDSEAAYEWGSDVFRRFQAAGVRLPSGGET